MREHVYLAAFMTEAIATGRVKEYLGAVSAFDENGVAFAKELRAQYGEDAERSYLALWRKYQQLLAAYSGQLAFGIPAKTPAKTVAKIKKRNATTLLELNGLPAKYGPLMSSITPLLNPFRAAKLMADVLTEIESFIGSQVKKDFGAADLSVRSAAGNAESLGTAIASAMIEDHPAIFPGSPNTLPAQFRYRLSALLSENVYLLSFATQESATGRSAELKAATAALKASTSQLAAHLGSAYGSDFVKSFTPLWEGHSNLILSYAAAGKDKAKKDKAAADLDQHTKDVTTFFVGANSKLDAGDLQHFLSSLGNLLKTVVDNQVGGTFETAGVSIRGAAEGTDALGVTFTRATVLNFPRAFQPPEPSSQSPSAFSSK